MQIGQRSTLVDEYAAKEVCIYWRDFAVSVRLQSLIVTKTKAGKHTTVCTQFGFYTYKGDSVQ